VLNPKHFSFYYSQISEVIYLYSFFAFALGLAIAYAKSKSNWHYFLWTETANRLLVWHFTTLSNGQSSALCFTLTFGAGFTVQKMSPSQGLWW
jgi:hypothetical protein